MVARVTLEIALRKEFDYAVPQELAAQVDVGSRVKVPFGPRQVLGVVTAVLDESTHTNLRPILKVVGRQTLVTPEVLRLARWIGEYYCCPPETALRSVLPEAVRKEEEGWKQRLHVRALPEPAEPVKLTKRQQEILAAARERGEVPLQEFLSATGATAETVRRLEDKGLVSIVAQISERDPYANESIVPTTPLTLNAEQSAALARITEAMDGVRGGTRLRRVAAGVPPAATPVRAFPPITEPTISQRSLPHIQIPGRTYHVTWRTHDHLRLPDAARRATLDSCRFWHAKKCHLHLACVMPDHVHLLLQPLPVDASAHGSGVHSLSELLHSIKSFSAHEVNKVMNRTGPVWDDESFDRMIRSESDLHEKWNYIWNNPRETGLVGPLDMYPFMWGPTLQADAPSAGRDARHDPPEAGATRGGAVAAPDKGSTAQTFLLHGVTGSGKTEVYLQAIAHALQQGRGAIVLVPEISLTPQTVERFKARFSSGPLKTMVAVLHSHLSAGERHDEWHKIRQGRARIVIGARSAVFAPVSPLGLIIVDEEHEHSYKQEESPRYHARDVAVVRGQMEGAPVVLGSATPSMESFHNAHRGKYARLDMPSRIDDRKMPIVRVIDMRDEGRKEKGTPIFSQKLKDAITTRLEKSEQVILFLNRRGFATSLQCPKCGYVAECPNCSVSLTYHRRAQKIACHICGHEARAPAVCPDAKCRNPEIRFSGTGTEKLEDTLVKLFPHARIARMDSDLMKRKEDYRRVLGEFKAGKLDILVGTQMIAKGLHFENVTLVGVAYADLSLHVPDFRAGERTFQLLTQVAGRAGRGEVEGEVIVQAFTPFHPAIQFARRHDYEGFYEQEIEFRRQLNYPPASRLVLLTLRGRNEEKVAASADHLREALERVLSRTTPAPAAAVSTQMNLLGEAEPAEAPLDDEERKPPTDVQISGPAPAPLARAETYYRYQVMLRTRQMSRLSRTLAEMIEKLELPEDVALAVDVDPVSLT